MTRDAMDQIACVTCSMRHNGETSFDALIASMTSGENLWTCAVCLGALQMRASVGATTATTTEDERSSAGKETEKRREMRVMEIDDVMTIARRAIDRGHRPKEARVEIILPAATATRERAYAAALAKARRNEGESARAVERKVVGIDEVLREACEREVARALGCARGGARGEGYALTVKYKYGDDAKETAFLDKVALTMTKEERNERRGYGWGGGKKRKRDFGIGHLSSPEDPFEEEFATARRLYSDATRKLENERFTLEEIGKYTSVPPQAPRMRVRCVIEAHHEPIHVGGWYMKLDRSVTQSPWINRETGKRVGRGSVVEAIESVVLRRLGSSGAKFNSSGREDMDVRMLGSGRPFAIQVHNPKLPNASASDFADMEREINEKSEITGVRVRGLCASTKEKYHDVGKDGTENEKEKSYTALVRISRPATDADFAHIAAQSRLVIHQSTPTRVAHRRADLVRPRVIVSMSTDRVPGSPDTFLLHLRTQAGTYIKEFVHSDEGRTTPSLGELLKCKAEIIQLDVTEVDDEWHP